MSDAPAAQETVEQETTASGSKVFVGNLGHSTTNEGLKAFFQPVANDILSSVIILRGTRSAGYGFVALSSPEAAERSVELLHKKELNGREITVEVAKPKDQRNEGKKEKRTKRRLGRRGSKAVPGEVSEVDANGDAEKPEGTIATFGTDDATKPKKKKKSSRSKKTEGETDALVTLAAPAEGAAADAPKKTPRVRTPRAPRTPRSAGASEDPADEHSKTMLFVANLGFSIDDAGLRALFTEAGINVVSARIVRRSYGKPRKSKVYGFVDVGSEEEQRKAIYALDGKAVGNSTITVKKAVNTSHEEEADDAEAWTGAKVAV